MHDSLAIKVRFPPLHEKILVAVSGGLDSSVLLDLLAKKDYILGVAHVNFQLRGEQSDGDEDFVRELAAKYNKPFFVRRFETNNYATEKGLSIQMAARELRYTWFDELRNAEHYDYTVTAHHLNDNIETVLHHFIRGTGFTGLIGIPEYNDGLVRPLLTCTLAEIRIYAEKNKLKWREDSSNATDDYGRNFIRHQIVPKMKELNGSLEDTWLSTHERLIAAQELFNMGLDSLKTKYIRSESDCLIISKGLLDAVDHPAGILWEIIKPYGFNLSQCKDIAEAFAGQSGKTFLAGDKNRLTIDRDNLVVYMRQETPAMEMIGEEQTSAALGRVKMKIKVTDKPLVTLTPKIAVLDRRKVTFPLVWRPWKHGDFFYPSGMNHRKKLSDFLIDKKIPAHEKDTVTVVESAGSVIWIPGHRVDERFRATDETTSVLILELE
jgi:tRNA(Ile)-lysidine synthase